MTTIVKRNSGRVFPLKDGKWVWSAQVGRRVLESVAHTRDEAEREAWNAEREMIEKARLEDTDPGRWGDHASPQRMRRDIARDRDEDRTMGNG